jgi:hypothetical protein
VDDTDQAEHRIGRNRGALAAGKSEAVGAARAQAAPTALSKTAIRPPGGVIVRFASYRLTINVGRSARTGTARKDGSDAWP